MKGTEPDQIHTPSAKCHKLTYHLLDAGRLEDILYRFGWYQFAVFLIDRKSTNNACFSQKRGQLVTDFPGLRIPLGSNTCLMPCIMASCVSEKTISK